MFKYQGSYLPLCHTNSYFITALFYFTEYCLSVLTLLYLRSTERVCQLLAANVSVNLIDSPDTANTPLHWAACYANKETVQCLISKFLINISPRQTST